MFFHINLLQKEKLNKTLKELNIIKKLSTTFGGIAIGITNALFGAGGGMLSVPIIKSKGKSQKEAQASTMAVILPLSVISSAIYLFKGYCKITDALPFIPFSLLGSVVGTTLMKKIPDKLLRKFFAVFMLYLGVRMIMK